ncbi:TPA: hypothetical protein KRM61_000176 [Clostridioides difficile]|nr:hypothetical protein [Clostridioides difficile]HBH1806566.1 hypothetical protein [Clostridioides difficile]HEK4894182.1 hypothetical protein [Clostridioides difficile]
MLWLSKISCYEQSCNVTGIGNIQAQSVAPNDRCTDRNIGTWEADNVEEAIF